MVASAWSRNKGRELVLEQCECWEWSDIFGSVVREGPSDEVSRKINECARWLPRNKVSWTERTAREKALT